MRDLETVVKELISTYEELAFARAENLRVRLNAYKGAMEPSVAARDREADYAGQDTQCQIYELLGRLEGLLCEKAYLERLQDRF